VSDRQVFMDALDRGLRALNLSCADRQRELMWRHFELLQAANEEVNLTTITTPADAAVRHFADSLAVAAWMAGAAADPLSVADIGTGGGFPALPLAVLRPAWHITAIDGTGRKVGCVQQFIERLELSNCAALQGRAEHWEGSADFDAVLFRAVAPLAECLRKARRITRPGTVIACYKSDPLAEDERRDAEVASLCRLFEHVADWRYALPCSEEMLPRQLCVYRRV
jgi:16S rRNA (guanine527-N7)-methyltransferase